MATMTVTTKSALQANKTEPTLIYYTTFRRDLFCDLLPSWDNESWTYTDIGRRSLVKHEHGFESHL